MESRRGRTFHGFGNEIMSAKIGAFIVVAGLFVASTGAARGAGNTAPTGKRPPVNTVARPPSLYEVYTGLKGSREFCYLPSEPCDNSHRVQN